MVRTFRKTPIAFGSGSAAAPGGDDQHRVVELRLKLVDDRSGTDGGDEGCPLGTDRLR
jgi:hypothetical protein